MRSSEEYMPSRILWRKAGSLKRKRAAGRYSIRLFHRTSLDTGMTCSNISSLEVSSESKWSIASENQGQLSSLLSTILVQSLLDISHSRILRIAIRT
ncbi:hypothetical protein NEOLEDRAFT_1135120 [Neolentinus lepideus HHB14362 ss-1]|uniref:Uncharacterized protein n=1 Tax=Neolentinus lepideus HHB14362 ss-1 TaxID=1314782 RepID=A0A165RVQ1_9AGAM|nr:hypothetical protein NEOLEDRAFT_1135120 [Neolentinus lepideus HHB14362 ss-1]